MKSFLVFLRRTIEEVKVLEGVGDVQILYAVKKLNKLANIKYILYQRRKKFLRQMVLRRMRVISLV